MATVEFRTAIRDALDEELANDERVILFGEDVAVAGGVFATTPGLYEKYGPERVFDTPISELALAGAAFGSAVTGLRPVVEIMFGDFLTLAMDSLVNQSAKFWYVSSEQGSVPLVVRSAVGAGGRFGAMHSQTHGTWFQGVPGLKIAFPSSPADAKGMLKAAIRQPLISEITQKAKYQAHPVGHPGWTIDYNNTDLIARSGKFSVLTGKTGYTDLALYCLAIAVRMAAAEPHDVAMVFLGAVGKMTRFADFHRTAQWLTERKWKASGAQAASTM